jgi:hypothetical protein
MRIISKGRVPLRSEIRRTESSPLTMGRRVEGWGGVNPPQTRPEACLGVVERRLRTNPHTLRLGGHECLDRSQGRSNRLAPLPHGRELSTGSSGPVSRRDETLRKIATVEGGVPPSGTDLRLHR